MRYLSLTIAPAVVALLLSVPTVRAADDAWGTVKGQVVFGGPQAPAAAKLDVTKDQEHCLGKGPILSEKWVVNPKTKGVQWTFVWLAPAAAGTKLPVHPTLKALKNQQVVMDQPCCRFEPHALGLQEGQVLVAKNSSPVPHNYNYQGGLKNPGENKLIPPKAEIRIDGLKASATAVNISCTIHPWMQGWVRVFDHPYFAVTDAEGNFTIKDAPAGSYQLISWHEAVGWGQGGKTGVPVTIKAGGDTEVQLTLKPE